MDSVSVKCPKCKGALTRVPEFTSNCGSKKPIYKCTNERCEIFSDKPAHSKHWLTLENY